LFGKYIQIVCIIESVSVSLAVEVHDSGSDVVEWQGDDCADDWGQEKSGWLDEIELTESDEPSFMEVIVWTGQWGVKGNVSDNIGKRSLVSGVLAFECGESLWDGTIIPSPFFSDLRVENLSNCDYGEGSGDISSNTTGNTSNNSFFPWSQIVSNLDRFGLIIDEFIESVSDSEITKPGDKVGFEPTVEGRKPSSKRVHLPEYFVGIVALVEGWK
jgi:hypothetical protein